MPPFGVRCLCGIFLANTAILAGLPVFLSNNYLYVNNLRWDRDI